jgi:hypothetical protein
MVKTYRFCDDVWNRRGRYGASNKFTLAAEEEKGSV